MDLHHDDANDPLLLGSDSSGGETDEFYDAMAPAAGRPAPTPPSAARAVAAPAPSPPAAATSYFGTASALTTGALFSPNGGRGIVDALPHPTKPCLLFADHDPLAAAAHLCLLEKECRHREDAGGTPPLDGDGDGDGHALFTVVHVCEPLAGRGDPGTRLLRKIDRGRGRLRLPALLHGGNVFQEDSGEGGTARLLPAYVDAAIGVPGLLTPPDAVGRYNMDLFIQRHSQLPSLYRRLLTDPSPTRRHAHAADLLALLKVIDADLASCDGGPYLCGAQFTLADAVLFPAMERVTTVLPVHRGFWLPSSLARLAAWHGAVAARPAARAAAADRSPASLGAYCYESGRRRAYLLEVAECHVQEGGAARFAELTAAAGRAGENVCRQECEEDVRDRRACEKTNCRNCAVM